MYLSPPWVLPTAEEKGFQPWEEKRWGFPFAPLRPHVAGEKITGKPHEQLTFYTTNGLFLVHSKSVFFKKRWILNTTLLYNNFKLRSLLKVGGFPRYTTVRLRTGGVVGFPHDLHILVGGWTTHPSHLKNMRQSSKWVGFIFPNFWGVQIRAAIKIPALKPWVLNSPKVNTYQIRKQ